MTRTLIFTFLLMLAITTTATSAQFSIESNRTMGCAVSLTGMIQKGDAARFADFVEHAKQELENASGRICLNSPGGSLSEAIKIARLIYSDWGTAVGANHVCESACSIIFMAGSSAPADDRGVIADRVLHPLGKLGFHAPSLVIGEGNYSSTTVSNAYNVALRGMGQLYDISGFIKFPPSLIGEMIATPPQKMMYIKTVGQASRWHIGVAPTVGISDLNRLAVINVCNNHYLFVSEAITLNGFYTRDHKIAYGFAEPKIERKSNITSASLEGFGQEAASVCGMSLFKSSANNDQNPTDRVGWVSIGDEVGVEYNFSQLFGPSTPIASLARENDLRIENINLIDRSKDIRSSSGRCIIFSGGKTLDNDPCHQISQIKFKNKSAYAITNYLWPSGAKTVVESEIPQSFKAKLNGVDTQVETIESWDRKAKLRGYFIKQAARDQAADWFAECWPNPATNNKFCYQQYFNQTFKFRSQ